MTITNFNVKAIELQIEEPCKLQIEEPCNKQFYNNPGVIFGVGFGLGVLLTYFHMRRTGLPECQ